MGVVLQTFHTRMGDRNTVGVSDSFADEFGRYLVSGRHSILKSFKIPQTRGFASVSMKKVLSGSLTDLVRADLVHESRTKAFQLQCAICRRQPILRQHNSHGRELPLCLAIHLSIACLA